MRKFAILGRKHGAKSQQVISGSEIPIHEQKEILKEFRRARPGKAHEEFAEVQFAEVVETITFLTPKEAHAKAKAAADRAKAAEETKAKAEAAKAAAEAAAQKPKALEKVKAAKPPKAPTKATENQAPANPDAQ